MQQAKSNEGVFFWSGSRRRIAVLSTPFRASMRERPCAGDWTNGPRPPWSPAYRHAPRWAQTAHSSPKWLNGHQAALHAPTLPAVAVVSADAVHRVALYGCLHLCKSTVDHWIRWSNTALYPACTAGCPAGHDEIRWKRSQLPDVLRRTRP